MTTIHGKANRKQSHQNRLKLKNKTGTTQKVIQHIKCTTANTCYCLYSKQLHAEFKSVVLHTNVLW